MKRKRLIIVGIALLVVIAATAFALRKPGSNGDGPEKRMEIVRAAPFVVKIRETGKLEPLVSVNVKSNVEGEIEKIYVREGEHVNAGDPLIKLDDERIREERIQADANLQSAKAQLEQAQRSVELTTIRQNALLESATDSVAIAEASLEAAQKSTTQQLSSSNLEIANTRSALEQDQIALNQDNISARQNQLSLDRANSRLQSAQVNMTNAESEFTRSQELYAKKFISKSALESAQSAFASAKTAFEQAEQDVSAAEESLNSSAESISSRNTAIANRRNVLDFQLANLETLKESRKAIESQVTLQLQTAKTELQRVRDSVDAEKKNSESSLAVANANYVRADSGLKNADERLTWTEMKSPMSGTIIALVVEEGEIVQSGRSAFAQGPAIMTIADLSKMVINTYINEVDIPKIEVGQRVEIHSDAYPERAFDGRVKEISPQGIPIENVTKFEVVVEVLGSPAELRPGMNVDVDIVVADREGVAQLPIETLIEKTKLIVNVAVPGEQLASLSVDQQVDISSRSGKRYGGRVTAINDGAEFPVVVFIDEGAPKGLRVGVQTLTLILKSADGKPEGETKLEDLRTKVESERKQLVLLPEEKSSGEKKPGFFKKLMPGGKKDGDKGGDKETAVKVGLRNDTAFEILQGLVVGDEVSVPDLSRLVGN